MAAPTTLSEWLAWLETLAPTEINLGLERVTVMLERLGLEDKGLEGKALEGKGLDDGESSTKLLIAGTNGKGSSVAMASGLLSAAGLSVGAYSSPHLYDYNERIRLNGVAADDATIIAAFERIEERRDGLALTYFEYGTLAAFVIFAAARLDVWVLEVGLGGRLDATNAISPDASLITNISLDHCDWLGDTLDKIAVEKAGVMRPNVPTVIGDGDAPRVLREHAATLGADLSVAGEHFEVKLLDNGNWHWRGNELAYSDLQAPGLSGNFQIDNAAAVIALLHAAGLGESLNTALINSVLPRLQLDARGQQLSASGIPWVFDVAHNPAAAEALVSYLGSAKDAARSGRTTAIVGVLDDKDADSILAALQPSVDRWVAVTPDNPRALPAAELAQRVANLSAAPCLICEHFSEAVEFAQRVAVEDDKILVTGSFFTVGPVLRYLQNHELVDA